MSLDMQGSSQYNPDVHYRHYLGRDGKPTVICVQDFDYPDYDASRFLDLTEFGTEEEAEATPVNLIDVVMATKDEGDAALAMRNIRAVLAHEQPPDVPGLLIDMIEAEDQRAAAASLRAIKEALRRARTETPEP